MVTTSQAIYYCHWLRREGTLKQYKPTGWSLRTNKGEPIVKTAEEWYAVISKTMKEDFDISGINHNDFLNVLKADVFGK